MRLRIIPLLFVVAGCAPAEAPAPDSAVAANTTSTPSAQDVGDARAAIDTYNDALKAAIIADDTATVFAMVPTTFDASGMSMQSGMPAGTGHSAITDMFRGWLSTMRVSDASIAVDDVIVSGDLSVETGRYAWTMTPRAGGAAFADTGKYVTIRRKSSDGKWLIIRDIGNSNKAP